MTQPESLSQLLNGRRAAIDATVPAAGFVAGWLVAGQSIWAGAGVAVACAIAVSLWRLRRGENRREQRAGRGQQGRAQHRAADPDMENSGDLTESARLHGVDEGAHPCPSRARQLHCGRCACAALRDVLGGSALRWVHDIA